MKKPEKNQGFNGIRTRDLRDTGAMLYQLSYEATHWERGQFVEFISSRCLNWKTHCEDHSSLSSITAVHMNYFIYLYIISLLTGRYELNKLTSLPMCGFIAQLVEHRTGIAEVTGSNPVEALIFFFQASSFQLLKLENSLRGSFFSFIYNRSSYELFHISLHHFTPHGKI